MTFFQCTFDDDALVELRRFQHLRRLDFTDCELPDGDWHGVHVSKTLTFLSIISSKEAPTSFAWLQAHDQLDNIHFMELDLSDAALQTLAQCQSPETVSFVGCRITDGQLSLLQGWQNVVSVHLARTQVTDKSLPVLRGMRPRELDVSSTALTAKAIAKLVWLPELRKLSCDGAVIDDEVVARLHQRQEQLLLRVKGNCVPLRRFLCEQAGPAPPAPVRSPAPPIAPPGKDAKVDPVPLINVEFY